MTQPYGKTSDPAELLRRQEARDAEAAEAARVVREGVLRNQAIRDERMATIHAARAEQARRVAEAQEAAMRPAKERMQRSWLADHPDRTAADFERHAWPHLRVNLLEDNERQALEDAKDAQRRLHGSLRGGSYSGLA